MIFWKITEDKNGSLWENRDTYNICSKSIPVTQYAVPHACIETANEIQQTSNLYGVRVFQDKNGHVMFINKTSWIILAKDPTRCHLHMKRTPQTLAVTAEQSR